MLSLRFKLSMSEFVGGRCTPDDKVELAEVPVVCSELSRLGFKESSLVSRRNRRLLLDARCTSAEVVMSLHN